MLTFLSHQLTEVALIKTKRPVLVLLWDTHSQGSVRYVESSVIVGKIKTCTLSWTHRLVSLSMKHDYYLTLMSLYFFLFLFVDYLQSRQSFANVQTQRPPFFLWGKLANLSKIVSYVNNSVADFFCQLHIFFTVFGDVVVPISLQWRDFCIALTLRTR